MLRLINIHTETVGMRYIELDVAFITIRMDRYQNAPITKPDFYKKQVCASVVDVDKQKELCKMRFNSEYGFGAKLLASKGEERTRLTTIDGELEQLIRDRYDK